MLSQFTVMTTPKASNLARNQSFSLLCSKCCGCSGFVNQMHFSMRPRSWSSLLIDQSHASMTPPPPLKTTKSTKTKTMVRCAKLRPHVMAPKPTAWRGLSESDVDESTCSQNLTCPSWFALVSFSLGVCLSENVLVVEEFWSCVQKSA